MTERSRRLAAAVERQHAEIVQVVESATEPQLRAPCDDDGGSTVAEVAVHCAEGYEMAAQWLRVLAGRQPVPAAAGQPDDHAHAHPHPHPHPHPHGADGAGAADGPAAMGERLRRNGGPVAALIRDLSDEQLDSVPAAGALTDGSAPLEKVFGGLLRHLQEHLGHMRAAVRAAEAGGAPGAEEDLLAALRRDPYPVYARLREAGAVIWMEGLRHWVATRHRVATGLLRDPRFTSDRSCWEGYKPPPGRERPSPALIDLAPAGHARLRGLVERAFDGGTLEQVRPRVLALTDELLAAAGGQSQVDLVEAFAGPLAAGVVAELLGIPAEERPVLRRLASGLPEPTAHFRTAESAGAALDELRRYLAGVVERRRREPGDDLLGRLLEAGGQGDRPGDDELLDLCVLPLVAGQRAAADLVASGVDALLDHPDQAERLRADPGLAGTAVEELLRYDAPVQMTGRVAVEDVELEGRRLRGGQMVLVLLGSANRDPEAFTGPDRLDVARDPNPHLAFGHGDHSCLGAPLARLVARVAIRELLGRHPRLRRAAEPSRLPHPATRSLATLPVRLT